MRPSEALAAHRSELRALLLRNGLKSPRVFGSVLNGTDTENSDLDLLADGSDTTTLFVLARVEHAAQELLGVEVSILTPGFLPEKLRGQVLERAQPL